ncbi:MAG: 3'-5' exonuclease, partial [Myxococcota bacterium]
LFNVEGDRNYFRRREIIDAVAWLQCVVDPGDALALVTLLRSPAVGVPDAALQPLFAAGLPARVRALEGVEPELPEELRDLVREVAENLPAAVPGLDRIAAWPLNLAAALFQLARLRASLLEDPGDVFVEKLRAYSLLEASEAGRFLGSWRVANLERFFAELAARFAAGVPLQEILRDLQQGVLSEEKREEARLRDLVPDAVRVMTLHGAKGLAFDHVYLMQLQKGSRPRGDGVDSRLMGGQLEFSLGVSRTLGWARALAASRAVSDAERARLLYVGSTRARQRLVLSGLPTAGAASKDSLSALLDARRPERPDAARVLAACRTAGSDRSELAEALHVVPALREEFEPVLRTQPLAELPDAARIQADAEALREARRAAAERMRRPMAASVSSSVEALRDTPAAGVPAFSAESARAGGVGSAVHSVLEALDLSLAPESALAQAREGLAAQLPRWFTAGHLEAGQREVEDLLEEISKGTLFARLFELGECVLARELPLLLRPGPEDAALGYVSGSIDLLYRDPRDGEWVIADYKTDRVADDAALEARADHHAAQGRYYVRAVREAFSLPADPRFELWFLRQDRRWIAHLSSA